MVDYSKTGDRLRKSGKLRILKIPIRKSGRMVEIGKIPPESGKLAGMQLFRLDLAHKISLSSDMTLNYDFSLQK
jgi:hypothetical protein